MNNLLPLLYRCDSLSYAFSQSHNTQYQLVRSLSSSILQEQNLQRLAHLHQQAPSSLRDKTIQRLQANVEQCLSALRDDLAKMEAISEHFDKLMFDVEVLLAESSASDTVGLNPQGTTQRLGALAEGAREELLRRRELLADMPDPNEEEDIAQSMQEWEQKWSRMIEYDRYQKHEMDELADALAATITKPESNDMEMS